MTAPAPWLADYAARKGLRYEPEADERWLRAWEPYTTIKVALRYEHALHATGESGSLTIARFVVPSQAWIGGQWRASEAAAWIVIAQDVRIEGTAAATSDAGRVFGESLDLVSMPRRATGDAPFDAVFASFAPSTDELARAVSPSLRKLTLGWGAPVHFELRPGGFVLLPPALPADAQGLSWLVRAVHLFGDKASKRAS